MLPLGVPRCPRHKTQFWCCIVTNYAFNCHSCHMKIKYCFCTSSAEVWLRSIRHYSILLGMLPTSIQFSLNPPPPVLETPCHPHRYRLRVQQRPMEPAQAATLLLRIQRSRLQTTDSAPNGTIYRRVFRRCSVQILDVFIPLGKFRNNILTSNYHFFFKMHG
jgi:hypothetical protein